MPPPSILRPLLLLRSGIRASSNPASSTTTTPALRNLVVHVPAGRVCFFASTASHRAARNRVYAPVRNHEQFLTYLQLSTSSRRPLLTFWTTSYCATCKQVSPFLKKLIESDGVGEAEGGVGYCEVEYDAPDVMSAGLGLTYMINSVPTLLSFDAGEAQVETKVADANKLRDRHFLEEWIRKEASRQGERGGGGGSGASLFGGLFKGLKK